MPCTAMTHDAERRAFAAEARLIEDLSEAMRDAHAATTAPELGKVYERLVGYDLHEDDPTLSIDGLRGMVIDHVREVCNDADIDVSLVGLTDEA